MGEWIDILDALPSRVQTTYLCIDNSEHQRLIICYYAGCGKFYHWPLHSSVELSEVSVRLWLKTPEPKTLVDKI